jgi:GH15 family glucan-1,4-alpha-glucosidase
MNNIVPLALDAIKRNVTRGYGVIAASEGPGNEYMHIWPRDSIFVALEMLRHDRGFAKKIVENIANLPHDRGMLYQRYNLDNNPDSKGWCNSEKARQLDQDALKFVAMSHFPKSVDKEKMLKQYSEFLKRIKNRDSSTDVWEQKRGYFFYTTSSIIWGLLSAEKIIPKLRYRHRKILKEMVKSLDSFYDEEIKSFVKSPTERIIDLEVVLGLNVLFESGLKIFVSREDLAKVISTLEKLEDELCYHVCGVKVPIRYKGDFWNGEDACGSCRPWPMGCALISQAYSRIAERALEIEDYELSKKALRNAKRWLGYMKSVPNMEHFPEQIDYDGSLPKNVPKPLTWCAAETLKADRIYSETKKKSPRLMFTNKPLSYN